jgi:hypothetical protein
MESADDGGYCSDVVVDDDQDNSKSSAMGVGCGTVVGADVMSDDGGLHARHRARRLPGADGPSLFSQESMSYWVEPIRKFIEDKLGIGRTHRPLRWVSVCAGLGSDVYAAKAATPFMRGEVSRCCPVVIV